VYLAADGEVDGRFDGGGLVANELNELLEEEAVVENLPVFDSFQLLHDHLLDVLLPHQTVRERRVRHRAITCRVVSCVVCG
jgi:hypothetical protein